jgi:hypothetical protein
LNTQQLRLFIKFFILHNDKLAFPNDKYTLHIEIHQHNSPRNSTISNTAKLGNKIPPNSETKHRQTRKQNTAKLGNKTPPNSETKHRQTRKQNTAFGSSYLAMAEINYIC